MTGVDDWPTQPIPRITDPPRAARPHPAPPDRVRHRRRAADPEARPPRPAPDAPRRPAREEPLRAAGEPERPADEPDEQPEPVLPTGHGHGHGPATPASATVRRLLAILLAPFALAALVGFVLLFPTGDAPASLGAGLTPVDGTVTAAQAGPCAVGDEGGTSCLILTVELEDGPAAGSDVRTTVPVEPTTPRFAVGDDVVLAYNGGEPLSGQSYQVVDFQRGLPLALLAGAFAAAVLALGRWKGLSALAALGLSAAVLVFFVLPAIVRGENPLLVGITAAGVIMFVALYLTHGFSARTSTAVLGTMISLALIGLLSALFSAYAALTGLDEETATLVSALGRDDLDTRGLLLAGIVIGALGVLDDVTVTQTSAVWELRAANPALTWRQLYAAGVRIGRDHVASAVNTLVMAYAGAALPLLLYSSVSGVGAGAILGSQSIAQEIVRTLVGSIGLVAAVPVTTALAALVAVREVSPASPRTG